MGNINNSKYDFLFSDEEKQLIINDYVNNKFSIRDIASKYNIKCKSWISNLLKDKIRSCSEATKIAHLTKSEHFKHSDETKQKLREIRLNYLKTHKEETAWRKANLSYPESLFIKYLKDRKLDLKYLIEREYSIFPYYIDFAFVDIKLAIEIDGSQHLLLERKQKDDEKDSLLIELGWKIIRISENIVKTDWQNIDLVLDKVINSNILFERVGIIKASKIRQKAIRNESGLTNKLELQHLNQRKVINRPSKEELSKLITSTSFVKVGEMFGVSDNTIRKWCKNYDLPFRKRDLK